MRTTGQLARGLWRTNRGAVIVMILALAVALFFAGRILFVSLDLARNHPDGPAPEGWMTPGFIGHTWGIDSGDMLADLDFEPIPGQRLTLAQIAARKGIPSGDFLEAVAHWLDENAGHD